MFCGSCFIIFSTQAAIHLLILDADGEIKNCFVQLMTGQEHLIFPTLVQIALFISKICTPMCPGVLNGTINTLFWTCGIQRVTLAYPCQMRVAKIDSLKMREILFMTYYHPLRRNSISNMFRPAVAITNVSWFCFFVVVLMFELFAHLS